LRFKLPLTFYAQYRVSRDLYARSLRPYIRKMDCPYLFAKEVPFVASAVAS